MKKNLLSSLLLLSCTLSTLAFSAPQKQMSLTVDSFPVFKIDLDLAPEERFKETAAHFKDQILIILNLYLEELPDFLVSMFGFLAPTIKLHQHEHFLEIQGISEVVEVDIDQVLLLNYLYELQAFCTSIVAKAADGTLMHGRNLDFSFADQMRDLTYVANWYKGGEHIFDSVMFAGDIGVYTGIKKGAFSVSENDRQ